MLRKMIPTVPRPLPLVIPAVWLLSYFHYNLVCEPSTGISPPPTFFFSRNVSYALRRTFDIIYYLEFLCDKKGFQVVYSVRLPVFRDHVLKVFNWITCQTWCSGLNTCGDEKVTSCIIHCMSGAEFPVVDS